MDEHRYVRPAGAASACEYRLASVHKLYGLDHAPVSGDHLALIKAAVGRGMTHPAIAENWLERRAPGGEWEKVD